MVEIIVKVVLFVGLSVFTCSTILLESDKYKVRANEDNI